MAIKVLLLSQWFEPEPSFKGLSFARELAQQGLDVEVVTGFPNYPGGKLYTGYKVRLIQKESIDGISITRLPLYPSHDSSPMRRVLNYISFGASATLYCLFRWRSPDVIYAYHPPLTVGVAAALVGTLRRIPVVLDVQDMWPDTLRATGMLSNPGVLSVVGKVCQWVYRRVSRVVVLSEGFRKLLLERGVPAEKVEVIPNWCDEAALTAPAAKVPPAFPQADRFRILFAGNMGKAQGLETVLAAAQSLQAECPAIVFVLMGAGVEVERLRAEAARGGLNNVVFLPPVPMSDVGGALNAADALLVHLRKDPLFAITVPSKTQAYMAVGKPILMAVDGDAKHLIEQADCGLVAESGNALSVATAALEMYRMSPTRRTEMGRNGRKFYSEQLSLRAGATRFARVFNALVHR